jgi:hypothetical protein
MDQDLSGTASELDTGSGSDTCGETDPSQSETVSDSSVGSESESTDYESRSTCQTSSESSHDSEGSEVNCSDGGATVEGSSSDQNEENSSDDGKSSLDEEAESEESAQSDQEDENPWDFIREAVQEACSPGANDVEECFLDEFETLYGIVETFLRDDVYRAVKDSMEVFQESHILMTRSEALSVAVDFRKAKILKYLEEDEPTMEPAAFVNLVGATSDVKEDEESEAKDYDHWDFINQKAKDVFQETGDTSLKQSFLDEFQRFFTLAEAFKGDAVVRAIKRTKHKLMMEDDTLDHKEGLGLAIEIRRRKILENIEDDTEDAPMESE